MSTVPYHPLMQRLGLSTHVQQLIRRRTKYPAHFCIVNDAVFISEQYAAAITCAVKFTAQIQQLTTHPLKENS